MPTPDDDIKRFQRIRDQQLAARVPSAKRDKYFKEYHARHPKQKPMTFKEVILVFSNKVRGLFIGVVLGVILWLVLPLFADVPWRNLAGLVAIIFLGGLGTLVGASFDWRDDIRKLKF